MLKTMNKKPTSVTTNLEECAPRTPICLIKRNWNPNDILYIRKWLYGHWEKTIQI